MSPALDSFSGWIGRTETRRDLITARPLGALAATLDRDDSWPQQKDRAAPLSHWLYFLEAQRQSDLGADGHLKRGKFLPPVPLPRRMFAGAQVKFFRPFRVGDEIERVSCIADVEHKEGRSGSLVFVRVHHEFHRGSDLLLTEDQDIVYRGAQAATSSAPKRAKPLRTAQLRREISVDEAMLFRFSALTFNGHRIHYDHRYATGVEGYPGLVVHGPLLATLLMDLVRGNTADAEVETFSFKAMQPVFARRRFVLCGIPTEGVDSTQLQLWVENEEGLPAMEATATLRKQSKGNTQIR
jgi:3-methylfumaryl-CoA hydratase